MNKIQQKAAEYYFNVTANINDRRFVVMVELDGYSSAGGYYGRITKECSEKILKTFEAIEKIGFVLPKGQRIELRSVEHESLSEKGYQPLSRNRMSKLVSKLNKRRNVFLEGGIGFEVAESAELRPVPASIRRER